jgi:hypothetical protein
MHLEIYLFSLDFQFVWIQVFKVFPCDHLDFIGVCCDSPFSSLTLLIWVFSLLFLVRLAKDLPNLFKDVTLYSLILYISFLSLFHSFLPQYCFLPSTNVRFGLFLFCRSLKCTIRLFTLDHWVFFLFVCFFDVDTHSHKLSWICMLFQI